MACWGSDLAKIKSYKAVNAYLFGNLVLLEQMKILYNYQTKRRMYLAGCFNLMKTLRNCGTIKTERITNINMKIMKLKL